MRLAILRLVHSIVASVLIFGTTDVLAELSSIRSEHINVPWFSPREYPQSVNPECQGKYKNQRVPETEWVALHEQQESWLRDFGTEEKRKSDTAVKDPRRANLCKADLSNELMADFSLSHSVLAMANMSGAVLDMADLSGASLFDTNLSGASLFGTNLSGADLRKANLSGAFFLGTNLSGALFEPNELPRIDGIATALNLSQLRYASNPQALIKLRHAFREAGYREQERAITYALKNSEQWRAQTVWDTVEDVFKYVFFDLPTQWGMSPGRALRILVVLIGIFSIPYVVVLRYPRRGRIYRQWGSHNSSIAAARAARGKVYRTVLLPKGTEPLQYPWKHAVLTGLQFSVLSAFHIGFREFNVGNWITRLQTRDYTLYATGWVRSVAGTQSLISVYLLAMWALTYFGRPFE